MRIKIWSLIAIIMGAFYFGAVCLADTVEIPVRITRDYGSLYFRITGNFTLGETAYSFDASALEAPNSAPRAIVTQDPYWYFTADRDEGYADFQRIPTLLCLENKLYLVQLDYNAKWFRLRPFNGDTILADVAIETERLSLTGVGASPSVMFYRPGKQIPIPLGEYKLDQYQLVMTDNTGVRWYVCAMGTDQSPAFRVGTDAYAALGIGGPYTPGVTCTIERVAPGLLGRFWGQGEREVVALSFALFGRWHENASQVYPIGDSFRPPPPKYMIRTAEGEILAQGRFRYG